MRRQCGKMRLPPLELKPPAASPKGFPPQRHHPMISITISWRTITVTIPECGAKRKRPTSPMNTSADMALTRGSEPATRQRAAEDGQLARIGGYEGCRYISRTPRDPLRRRSCEVAADHDCRHDGQTIEPVRQDSPPCCAHDDEIGKRNKPRPHQSGIATCLKNVTSWWSVQANRRLKQGITPPRWQLPLAQKSFALAESPFGLRYTTCGNHPPRRIDSRRPSVSRVPPILAVAYNPPKVRGNGDGYQDQRTRPSWRCQPSQVTLRSSSRTDDLFCNGVSLRIMAGPIMNEIAREVSAASTVRKL